MYQRLTFATLTLVSLGLTACGQKEAETPQTSPAVQEPALSSLQEEGLALARTAKIKPETKIYLIDGDTQTAYQVALSTADVLAAQSGQRPTAVTLKTTSDLERTPVTQRPTERIIEGQALATCEQRDGPFYRNRVLGVTGYETDVYLPSDTVVNIPSGGAFVYTGFNTKGLSTSHETGFQWTKANPRWTLYFRIYGDNNTGDYAPGTDGQWRNVNGNEWKMNSAYYAADNYTHIKSYTTYINGVHNLISEVTTNSSSYVIGYRYTSTTTYDLTSLRPENQANIYARKIVSMAYSGAPWPSTDTVSHVNNAKFRQGLFVRDGVVNTWPNYGCTSSVQGFNVYYDPASPYDGDTASIYK